MFVFQANQRLGMIKRSFDFMDKDIFLTLFKSIVRPHIEYGSSVWSVIYKKEAIQLENVQSDKKYTTIRPTLKDWNI